MSFQGVGVRVSRGYVIGGGGLGYAGDMILGLGVRVSRRYGIGVGG